MLQAMREKTQGIIAGTIIGLICLTFALWGIQNYTRSKGPEDAAAKVNGSKITNGELKSAYERARREMMMQKGAPATFSQDDQKKFQAQILQQLIKNRVYAQATKKLGLYVSDQQLEATIMEFPAFQVNGAFSAERLHEILSRMSISYQNFIDETRSSLLSIQLGSGLKNSIFVLPHEVELANKLMNQKRDISYFLIPKERFLSKIKVPDSEIKDYYQKHQNQFMTKEAVSIEYINLTASALTKTEKPSTEQLKKFYQENIDLYTKSGKVIPFTSARDAVAKAYAQHQSIQAFRDANEKLAELVYTNSDSLEPAAKALGLKIDTTYAFTRDSNQFGIAKDPKIVQAAFSDLVLQQRYNSNPIELNPGNVVVLRIRQHTPSQPYPLEAVRANIEKTLKNEAAQKMADELNQEVFSALSNTKPDSVAKKYKLKLISVSGLKKNDSHLPREIIETAFTLTKPKEGTMSSFESIKLKSGDNALLRLNHVNDDLSPMPLDARDKIKKDLTNQFNKYDNSLLTQGWMKRAKIETFLDARSEISSQ